MWGLEILASSPEKTTFPLYIRRLGVPLGGAFLKTDSYNVQNSK